MGKPYRIRLFYPEGAILGHYRFYVTAWLAALWYVVTVDPLALCEIERKTNL